MARAYPFLIAIVPILYFAANNPDKYGMLDLIFLLAVTAGACGVVYALAWLVARGRAAPGLPAFVALLYVAWFFGYRRAVGVLTGDPARAPHLLLVAVGLILSVALIWWVRRREGLLAGLGRFLPVRAALMVGWSAVQMGRGGLRGED
ncbi:MAG TPA: hypothetical protein VF061_06155, partial [Gemmatimonadales bacterium]